MGLFSNLAGALNSSTLALHAEPIIYTDRLGTQVPLDAIYKHSDENPEAESFEARESDFPIFPQPQQTITRANGQNFQVKKIHRMDGNWLVIDVRLLS